MKVKLQQEVEISDLHRHGILLRGAIYNADGNVYMFVQTGDREFNFINLDNGNRKSDSLEGQHLFDPEITSSEKIRPVRIPAFAKRVTHFMALSISDLYQ